MKLARVVGGVIVETLPNIADKDIYLRQYPNEVAYIPIGAEVGWMYDEEIDDFVKPEFVFPYLTTKQAEQFITLSNVFGLNLSKYDSLEMRIQESLIRDLPIPEPKEYDIWDTGVWVKSGNYRELDGVDYECQRSHITSHDTNPSLRPDLWMQVDDVWVEWVPPREDRTMYELGSKVTRFGIKWISELDGNIFPPGIYGWRKFREEMGEISIGIELEVSKPIKGEKLPSLIETDKERLEALHNVEVLGSSHYYLSENNIQFMLKFGIIDDPNYWRSVNSIQYLSEFLNLVERTNNLDAMRNNNIDNVRDAMSVLVDAYPSMVERYWVRMSSEQPEIVKPLFISLANKVVIPKNQNGINL